MVLKPEQVVEEIKKEFPEAKVESKKYPKDTIMNVERHKIITHLFGAEVIFSLGPNLVFSINGAPRGVYKYLPLAHPDNAIAFVQSCLKGLEKHIKKKDVPKVKAIIRKYFGKEEKVETTEHMTTVYYGKFILKITPNLVVLVVRKVMRVSSAEEFENMGELEAALKKIKSMADGIERGDII